MLLFILLPGASLDLLQPIPAAMLPPSPIFDLPAQMGLIPISLSYLHTLISPSLPKLRRSFMAALITSACEASCLGWQLRNCR
jgi:hypothetical protein